MAVNDTFQGVVRLVTAIVFAQALLLIKLLAFVWPLSAKQRRLVQAGICQHENFLQASTWPLQLQPMEVHGLSDVSEHKLALNPNNWRQSTDCGAS